MGSGRTGIKAKVFHHPPSPHAIQQNSKGWCRYRCVYIGSFPKIWGAFSGVFILGSILSGKHVYTRLWEIDVKHIPEGGQYPPRAYDDSTAYPDRCLIFVNRRSSPNPQPQPWVRGCRNEMDVGKSGLGFRVMGLERRLQSSEFSAAPRLLYGSLNRTTSLFGFMQWLQDTCLALYILARTPSESGQQKDSLETYLHKFDLDRRFQGVSF